MSAVLGQTTYVTTGFPNHNLVNHAGTASADYCAGCNGSFSLGFTSTTVGNSSGVFGVGFDVLAASPDEFAFVTFGDASTANYSLSPTSFFGITSTLEIRSIDVGLRNRGATISNTVEIDNLTIGCATYICARALWMGALSHLTCFALPFASF